MDFQTRDCLEKIIGEARRGVLTPEQQGLQKVVSEPCSQINQLMPKDSWAVRTWFYHGFALIVTYCVQDACEHEMT